MGSELTPGVYRHYKGRLYDVIGIATHSESGERLALVAERSLAFALARQNDLAPVSAH